MSDVLCIDPGFGSTWLMDAYVKDGYVIGWVMDESQAIPGHDWQPATMNFPLSCVLKDPDGITKEQVKA